MEVQKMKHLCKFCKKSFPCGRSLGGHIRSHLPRPGYELRENPKKTWRVKTPDHDHHDDEGGGVLLGNNSNFSSSSTETENPKSKQNQGKRSNFGRNNSHSSVSEVVEGEHQQEEVVVAMCLIMLSQDMGSWGDDIDISSSFAAAESSENVSIQQGKNINNNKSRRNRRREKIQGNVSVSVAANGKRFESADCGYLQKGLKLKGIEVSANGFCSNDQKNKRKREKVQSKECDVVNNVGKSSKVESLASGNVKNGGKINDFEVLENGFVSNDQKKKNQTQTQTPESKRKGVISGAFLKKVSTLEEFEVSENGVSSYDQKSSNDHHELDSELCNNDNKTSASFINNRRSKFECTTCNKVFHSYQALGGHRASHKKLLGGGLKCSPLKIEPQNEDVSEVKQQQQEEEDVLVPDMVVIGSSSSTSKKAVQVQHQQHHHKHECPICYRVFPSGQALGGHKRSHLLITSTITTTTNNAEIINGELKMSNNHHQISSASVNLIERLSSSGDHQTRDHLLDLNFPPAPAQEETTTTTATTTVSSSSNSLVGFIKPYWCVESSSSHKHEPLLGLISN